MPRWLSNLIARTYAEDGGFLVEILVTIVILAIVTGATLTMLESQSRLSGTQRVRAQAAEVAQQRLEELRAMPFDQLRTLPPSTTSSAQVGNQRIDLTSTVAQRPSADTTGECSTGRGRDVVQLSVVATWPGAPAGKAVRVDTLVAAPVGSAGGVRVQVVNANGVGVPGATASAAGRSAVTDAQGCAQIFLPPGNQSVTVSKPGFVPPNPGADTATAAVNAEKTTNLSFELDQPGSALVQFRYRRITSSGVESTIRYDSDPKKLQFVNGGLASGSLRVPNSPDDSATIPARSDSPQSAREYRIDGLYPFSGTYAIFAGACASQAPASPLNLKIDRNAVAPSTGAANVELWPLNVRIRSGASGKPPAGTVLTVISNCDPSVRWQTTALADITGLAGPQQIARNGFPFGATTANGYTVCAKDPNRAKPVWSTDVRTGSGGPTTLGPAVDLDVANQSQTGSVPAGC